MKENLDFVLQVIRVDVFIAFGLYSIIYILISSVTKNPILEIIDESSNKLIWITGIIFFFIWISLVLLNYYGSSEYERLGILQRMFGKYWFGYWLQPALWICATQLLRFKKIRKQKFLRLFFSIVFIISVEQYFIMLTSLHRDYLPSSWSFHFTSLEFMVGIFTKLLQFLILVALYYFVEMKIKTFRAKSYR